jgi:hypothetical protein
MLCLISGSRCSGWDAGVNAGVLDREYSGAWLQRGMVREGSGWDTKPALPLLGASDALFHPEH